jgi:putative peptide zinc metalloprotease protein
MQLFSFEYAGRQFALVGSGITGAEQLLMDGEAISKARNFSTAGTHAFALPEQGAMRLEFKIDVRAKQVNYALYRDGQLVLQDSAPLATSTASSTGNELQPQPDAATSMGKSSSFGGHSVSLLGIGFKLLKTVNVVKVVLAGSALAAWSILFSWQFALVLIGVLVFHEYGHLRAMKKCGLKTKGMYLIPFVGGVAVGEKATSYWHEVYISMMGPVFGLFMTVAFYILFLITGSHFVGLVASVSALVNLFNLLPVYPLDGGHVVKSLVMSGQNRWSVPLLLAISAACFGAAMAFGFYFLSFFIVIGALDLLASRSQFATHPQTPLDRNGIIYCTLWYFVVVAIFIAIIVLMANSNVPGTEIATAILQS